MHRCIFGKNCDEKGTSPLPGLLKPLVEREILESFLGTNGLSGKIFQNKDLAWSEDLASELGSSRDAWRSRSLRQTADGRRRGYELSRSKCKHNVAVSSFTLPSRPRVATLLDTATNHPLWPG